MHAMDGLVPIVNRTMELSGCQDSWTFNEQYGCWCLEDVLYTEKADVPKFQRLSIFVPKGYMHADGTPDPDGRAGKYTGKNAPVVFANNSAGYMQMPHTWLGGPRCSAEQYLRHGLVYVTCGCRGRESRNAQGEPAGKAPVTLVDLKTAVRFLRHSQSALPGDLNRIISVGWSAGGAMSALLGLTGDDPRFDGYLRQNGAFMEESDAVFAAQVYCPIIDLEHADMAYEWCFGADKTSEDCMCGPAETMTPFKEVLSRELSGRYTGYVNAMNLRHPETGEPLTLGQDGRSGPYYDYLMKCLEQSAAAFLSRLAAGTLPLKATPDEYLSGEYTYEAPAPVPPARHDPGAHHAGPGVRVPLGDEPDNGKPLSLGDLMSRPPRGVPFRNEKPPMVTLQGKDKRAWLSWDGEKAKIAGLDEYVLSHRGRMKPCTAFDMLDRESGENQLFGDAARDSVHFSPSVREAVHAAGQRFPAEAEVYEKAFPEADEAAVSERVTLINPMRFITGQEKNWQARHFRIRVGARDADTSLSVAMTLAVKLQNAGFDTDFAFVWDQPHCEADYPGEVLRWIDSVCR